ncbi:MAG: hypothetical protein Q9218_000001 [Villophora microphyllina]
MEAVALAILPTQRRDAYQPSDLAAYLRILDLSCFQDETEGSKPEDPLCSHCKEVQLGEALLDEDDNETEHRIALYTLPCGHLRCCSCALKYVDAAGILYRICQACDDQMLGTQADLTHSLGSVDRSVEPDMGWIPNFRPKKRKSLGAPSLRPPKYAKIDLPDPQLPKTPPSQRHDYPAIRLPSIGGVSDFHTTCLQTPATKRKRRGLLPSEHDIYGSAAPSPFQWTPQTQRRDDLIHKAENEIIPEEDDKLEEEILDQEMTPTIKKKRKLREWGSRDITARKLFIPCPPNEDTVKQPSDREVEQQTLAQFLEEETRLRKRPKYAF